MSLRIVVFFFVLLKPVKSNALEPTCSRFDYDERILRKLLELERFVHELETKVTGYKVLCEGCILNLEDKLEKALQQLENSCNDGIRAATANVVQIPPVEQDGWELVFRGTAGNGDSIEDAWFKGLSVTTDKPINMKRSLDKHYVNLNFLNDWNSRNVARVKVAFYYNEMEVVSVVFNAKGSTRDSWFHQKNLLHSSWPSLTKTGSFNIFSLNAHSSRRFYISKNHGGCDKDAGYMVTKDFINTKPCDWEAHPSYPMFLYSKSNGPTVWDKHLYGMADYIAVFVQY